MRTGLIKVTLDLRFLVQACVQITAFRDHSADDFLNNKKNLSTFLKAYNSEIKKELRKLKKFCKYLKILM